MSKHTILVIDDSATIRKLVDSTLSPLGYIVHLSPNAEDGLDRALELKPKMILLDHQLPGTTGFDVATQLSGTEELKHIPVVISSTLRNKAYMEYSELPNVVDMLPKPYAAELLISTVANAVETGAMIVQSQTSGSAVPEVIEAVESADLQGSMNVFSIREILDLLNNGGKTGVLEIEAERVRTWVYLKDGRIQGVASNDHDQETLIKFLPDALQDLAPVLELTSGGGMMTQVDGLVQLLNRKVLDPRLLGRLLRYQAALLLYRCFTRKLVGFRFETQKTWPPLFDRLPLDLSLLALLVDAATQCDESELPTDDGQFVYSRSVVRGQNLDRSGLAARQIQLLKLLAEPQSMADLVQRTGWEADEVRRVLYGMQMADLVQRQARSQAHTVLALEPDAEAAGKLKNLLAQSDTLSAKVVRDRLAFQLVIRRSSPDAVVFPGDDGEIVQFVSELRRAEGDRLSKTRWIAVGAEHGGGDWAFPPDATVGRGQLNAELLDTLAVTLAGEEASVGETLSMGAN